jgi:hypothetical protein
MNTTLHRLFPALAAALALGIGHAAANYADSTNIRVDTRGRNLVSLTVAPAPLPAPAPVPEGPQPAPPPSSNTVAAGGTLQFLAWALYDDNSTEDVTSQAAWHLGAGMPNSTEIFAGLLKAGQTGASIQSTVKAAFVGGSRTIIASCAVEVLPGPQLKMSAVVELTPGGFLMHCTAQVAGTRQAVTGSDIHWDLNDADNSEDYTVSGVTVTKEGVAKRSYLIRIRAWADGAMIYRAFMVPVSSLPPPGAPVTLSVQDITVEGLKVWNGSALVIGGLQTGKTGLAVVIHGLWGSTDPTETPWVGGLCGAIQGAVSSANVAAWDWKLMADPSLYSNGYTVPSEIRSLAKQVISGDLFVDLLGIRKNGRTNGCLLAERLLAESTAGRLGKSTPIHLIGHSAGGFVAGECALYLKKAGFSNLQVTMLDTPVPFSSHVDAGWRTERYISSWLGSRFESEPQTWTRIADLYNLAAWLEGYKLETINYTTSAAQAYAPMATSQSTTAVLLTSYNAMPVAGISEGSKYRRVEIQSPALPTSVVDRHGFAHEWYAMTVNASLAGGGFVYSNLLGSLPFPAAAAAMPAPSDGPQKMPQPDGPQPAPPAPVDLDGFTYFGTAGGTGGVHTLMENTDAGFWKAVTMPVGSDRLRFRYRFTSAGDGDFIAAYWGEDVVLVIAPDTASAQAGFVEMEADVSRFGGQQGNLVFKLVSRGEVNAVAQIDRIQIVLSDDPDGDGLSNTEEIARGSNPHLMDSDGDGLSDYDEAMVHGTNPTQSDSDGDTVPDLAELMASTNPMNRASALRPRMERGAGNQLELRWPGVTGRSYSVVRSLDLEGTSFDFVATGVPGGAVGCSLIDPQTAVNPKAFYWVLPE